VQATVNILKFAGTTKTKHLLYTSSLLAVDKANEDGTFSEEFPNEEDFGNGIRNGYALTKFVCEKLMAQALERGIPVTMIRYASLFGDSVTGYMPPVKNHAYAILLSCIRVRCFPRVLQSGLPIMAVDAAAQISAQIFLSDSTEGGLYNLTSDSVVSDADILEVFKQFGVEGGFVPFSEWRDLLFEDMDDERKNMAPFLSLYEDEENSESPKYMQLHPLAVQVGVLNIYRLSEKVKRNCAGAVDKIVPAKSLLELHLKFHFQQLAKIK
jgi:thioester reductase-like protein